MIVKFAVRERSRAGAGADGLSAIADPAGDARLIQVARDFGERVGIPLLLESLTSGRELLLAVDQQGWRLRLRSACVSATTSPP